MSTTSRKPFDAIHDDYAFFQKHSTEAEADISAYVPLLQRIAGRGGVFRMLDFGSGDGIVTSELLSRVHIPPEQLRLSLCDPDARYRDDAVRRLCRLTAHPISAWGELPPNLHVCFDGVIANNALYYVEDLEGTLSALIRALASPGVFIASVAGRDNALVQYTLPLFELIGKPYPFWLAEECLQTLRGLGEDVVVEDTSFDLRFPDSEEGRLSMARFLMGNEYPRIPRQTLLAGFDRHLREGNITIRTTNKHLIVMRQVADGAAGSRR